MSEGYVSPLSGRYADNEMQYIFSDDFKFKTWRKCWLALAEAQCELGVEQVKPEYLEEMRKAIEEPIDYDLAKKKEKEIRHDVMAHVHEFGTHCPKARGIIHLGATSMYVCDNTELIQMREAIPIIKAQVLSTIKNLRDFANEHRDLVTLGYTHYQPAQPTTVGKRTCMYVRDLMMDFEMIENAESFINARGAKGTVGSYNSYLSLFDGDFEKVKKLDLLVMEKLGFKKSFTITGQTYPRKLDTIIATALAGLGESATKFATDLRLASQRKEIEEPFAKNQTGSSAMAYKRNPMRSERVCALSRELIGRTINFYHTTSSQWYERTLDDSAIRRMDLPEVFLLSNAIMKLYQNVSDGMVVYPGQISKHLKEELPFMATEEILMHLSSKGFDRQEMHEIIKKHSVAAGNRVKSEGVDNDLFERLADDEDIPVEMDYLQSLLDNPERFAGASAIQTEHFVKSIDNFLSEKKEHMKDFDTELNV